jgi:hypothetical protein
MHAKCWLESAKGKSHLKDGGIGRRIILKWILGKLGVYIGFIWLRIGTTGGLL